MCAQPCHMSLLIAALTLGLWAAQGLALIPQQDLPSAAVYTLHSLVVDALSTVLVVFILRAHQRRLQELNKLGDELAEYNGLLEHNTDTLERAQAVAKVGSWVLDIAGRPHQSHQCRVAPSSACQPGLSRSGCRSTWTWSTRMTSPDLMEDWRQALKSGRAIGL
jgi:hypothetical protein